MQYRRRFVPGGTLFFTLVTHERRPILESSEAVDLLMEAFEWARERHPFYMDSHVILPDHVHAVWTLPDGDSDYSTRWRLVKTRFTKTCNPTLRGTADPARIRKQEQAVWQHRFWEHVIRDGAEYERIMDYVHRNPVKHGYVKYPVEWPHSSIHRYIAAGIYPVDWGAA